MFKRLWQTSPELIATAALMLIVLAGAMVGLAVDPTVITGAPAWLKPAKFAVVHHHLHGHAGVDLHPHSRVDPHPARRRLGDRGDDGARDGHHRRPGLARDDEPFQRRDAG